MPVNPDNRIRTIESLLAKYGLSNRWLAKKIGVNHTSINSWLAPEGSRPRDPGVYDQMIEVLSGQGPLERNLEVRRTGVRVIPIYAGIPAGNPTSHNMDLDYEEVLDWGSDFERLVFDVHACFCHWFRQLVSLLHPVPDQQADCHADQGEDGQHCRPAIDPAPRGSVGADPDDPSDSGK